MSAFLATPAAIDFQREHNWDAVRRACHDLARETRARINTLTGFDPICPDSEEWFAQLVAIRLPDSASTEPLTARLYDELHIEVPLYPWNGINLIRVSFQGYNSRVDALSVSV